MVLEARPTHSSYSVVVVTNALKFLFPCRDEPSKATCTRRSVICEVHVTGFYSPNAQFCLRENAWVHILLATAPRGHARQEAPPII